MAEVTLLDTGPLAAQLDQRETLDMDFLIYRQHDDRPLPLMAPFAQ